MKKFLVGALIIFAASFLVACEVSTASLSDARLCSDADSDGNCNADSSTFKTTDKEIFLSAQLENAPSDTTVTATWTYLRGDLGNQQQIDSVNATAKDGGSMPFYSSLTAPASGWPKGDYQVTLTLSSDNSTPITKPFSIK